MFNKKVVYEALKQSQSPDTGQDGLVSLMIHDAFGGEILKTHKKKKWFFYNRIDGERVVFAKTAKSNVFEDIPSNPDEINDYFDQADYSTFFLRFVRAFEETVGLDKYRTGLTA
jgi:hypothetical protein